MLRGPQIRCHLSSVDALQLFLRLLQVHPCATVHDSHNLRQEKLSSILKCSDQFEIMCRIILAISTPHHYNRAMMALERSSRSCRLPCTFRRLQTIAQSMQSGSDEDKDVPFVPSGNHLSAIVRSAVTFDVQRTMMLTEESEANPAVVAEAAILRSLVQA